MYIKLNNQIIEKYPYSVDELRKDNPQISFPENVSNELLKEFGVFPVVLSEAPQVDFSKNVIEDLPVFENSTWNQKWKIVEASQEEILNKVINARANEYPDFRDYLDGIVKNDQSQIEKYISDCLAVKEKYPKP